MTDTKIVRRPIKARGARWARSAAGFLASRSIKPNWISLASVVFAALGGMALVMSRETSEVGRIALFLAAALCVQARLLCNLLDGMVAVEGGLKTKSGEIYNDLPDRIADPILLVAAGYAIMSFDFAPAIGWLAGLLSVMTAYARLLGGACGLPQRFQGPMAKQHRMAVLTGALLIAAGAVPFGYQDHVLLLALLVVVLGSVLTVVRRTGAIARELEER